MYLVIGIALMVVALIGIIWCQKKQKTNPNAQAFAFVFLILIIAGAGTVLWDQGIFGGEDREMNKIIKNETAYAAARSEVIGKYLVGKYAGKKAVIITEKDLENNKINKAAYDAMVKALNGIEVEATEVLNTPETSPDNPMPMESLITAKLFNEIFNKYPNTNLFIIMTSLPFNTDEVQKLSIWKKDPKKTQAVIVNGEVYNLKRAIGAGYIAATAVMKNDSAAYDPERTAPSDPQKAFDVRYILVTPENVADVAKKNAGIFAK